MIKKRMRRLYSFVSPYFQVGPAGRSVSILPDDLFLVSYPKSGNTWLRFLIANALNRSKPVTFLNIEQKVPDIYISSNARLLQLPRPRILKSHEYFDPRYKRVIYIVRDPRDVAVSYYHHQIKFQIIGDNYPLEGFVQRFIEGELDSYGSWAENVGSWMGARESTLNFMFLRYEDLLADPHKTLLSIASMFPAEITADDVDRAVCLSTSKHMRELEKKEGGSWPPIRNTRKDKEFIRAARSGDWIRELPSHLARRIEEKWTQQMKSVGYLQ